MRRVFLASLIAAVVLLSVLTYGGAPRRVVTGTVTEWHVGELISVASDQNPAGLRIALRETVYQGDTRGIKPGARVTVWYRSVGEGRPVADKVRVVAAAARR